MGLIGAITMAVFYKLYQDNRKNGTRRYYARPVALNVVDTNMLADRIQVKCTLHKSDILACIAALVEEMRTELCNSNIVKLDGFGIFKASLKSTGADDPKLFNVSENIQGVKVNFLPSGHKSQNGKITRDMLDGVTVKKYE